MKIYTKTGDDGSTQLIGGKRVSKSSFRLKAYGDLDELNSVIGYLISSIDLEPEKEILLSIQEKLFHIGCVLADPGSKHTKVNFKSFATDFLESEIDRMEKSLAPLSNFILPGGTKGASIGHMARTICRRCERSVVEVPEKSKNDELTVVFLNRLSDYFFILSRYINKAKGVDDIIWEGL